MKKTIERYKGHCRKYPIGHPKHLSFEEYHFKENKIAIDSYYRTRGRRTEEEQKRINKHRNKQEKEKRKQKKEERKSLREQLIFLALLHIVEITNVWDDNIPYPSANIIKRFISAFIGRKPYSLDSPKPDLVSFTIWKRQDANTRSEISRKKRKKENPEKYRKNQKKYTDKWKKENPEKVKEIEKNRSKRPTRKLTDEEKQRQTERSKQRRKDNPEYIRKLDRDRYRKNPKKKIQIINGRRKRDEQQRMLQFGFVLAEATQITQGALKDE